MDAGLDAQSLDGLGRADDRLAHRQGLEDLVLHPPGDPERGEGDRGPGQVRPDVGDLADHLHPSIRPRSRTEGAGRRPTSDTRDPGDRRRIEGQASRQNQEAPSTLGR